MGSGIQVLISAAILAVGVLGVWWIYNQPCSIDLGIGGITTISLPQSLQRAVCSFQDVRSIVISLVATSAVLAGAGYFFSSLIKLVGED